LIRAAGPTPADEPVIVARPSNIMRRRCQLAKSLGIKRKASARRPVKRDPAT
jgi:hypothetical protein